MNMNKHIIKTILFIFLYWTAIVYSEKVHSELSYVYNNSPHSHGYNLERGICTLY